MKKQLLSIAWIALFTLAITSPSHAIPTIWESNFGANLGLTDDSATGVSFGFSYDFLGAPFTGATVSSNGFIRLAPSSGSLCCDANVGTFLSGTPMIAAAWFDIRPPIVFYNTFAGRAVVTWEAPEFSSSTVNRYQAQLFQDGSIIFGYDVLSPVSTGHRHDALIGVTPGDGATDPGEIDYTSALPFNSGSNGTVYEFFARRSGSDNFDLSGTNICYDPNGSGGWNVSDCTTAVPEPSTLLLLGSGLMGLAGWRWRRSRMKLAS